MRLCMAGFARSIRVFLYQTKETSSVGILNHQVVCGCSILSTICGQQYGWVIAGARVHGLLRKKGSWT